MAYEVLNYFFFFFHTSLIIFNSFGWIFPKFRKWNLITLILTAFSWFVLGIWFGWGFCVCTDWHWTIRIKLGYQDISNSYIHFLILKFTGINFPEGLVNTITAIVFFSSLIISLWLNIRDYRRMMKLLSSAKESSLNEKLPGMGIKNMNIPTQTQQNQHCPGQKN